MSTFSHQQIAHIEPVLLRYATRALRREDLARDLVQETWAAALVSLPGFEARSTLRTWMVGILRRKIVDHHRRQKPTTSFSEEWHGTQEAAEPEAAIDGREAVREVGSYLKRLPRRQRGAVELCDVAGQSRSEAAKSLGISDGHLRVVLHRGRKRLREELERDGHRLAQS
jgi:RNA polymerase sigma factor (sigma-70 family)